MPRTSRIAKRICAFALTLVMVLSMNVSTLAEGENPGATPDETTGKYTITIKPNSNTLTPTAPEGAGDPVYGPTELVERFKAYAIFTGQLNVAPEEDGGYDGTSEENGNNPPNANQLANVVWGKGINEDAIEDLLEALMDIDAPLAGEASGNLGVSDLAALKTAYDTDEDSENGTAAFTVAADTTLGELFAQALYLAEYATKSGSTIALKEDLGEDELAATAAVIAKVISKVNGTTTGEESGETTITVNNNAAVAKAFAKVVAAKNSTGAYLYLTAVENDIVPSKWDGTNWKLEVSDPGYYLIVDTYESDPDSDDGGDEISDYILAVFGNQTIRIKSNAVTMEKTILATTDANGGEGSDNLKGASAGIGDKVTFKLTGTLPENYDNYKRFTYIFHDTLGDGLKYDVDSVKVTVKVSNPEFDDEADEDPENNPKYLFVKVPLQYTGEDEQGSDVEITNYSVVVDDGNNNNTDDDCNLHIAFKNLKKLGDNDGLIKLANDSVIYVEYTVTVDKEAAVVNPDSTGKFTSSTRNSNTAFVEYSNDVNNNGGGDGDGGDGGDDDGGSTSKTTKDKVYVYVYGLDVDKINGAEDDPDDNALAGAGFAMKKTVANMYPYYATNAEDAEPAGYVSEKDLLAYLGEETMEGIDWADVTEEGKLGEAADDYSGSANLEGKYLWLTGASAPAAVELTYYAVFTKDDASVENTTEYAIAGWIEESALEALLDLEGNSWEKGYAANELTAVSNLEDGTYYLTFTTVDTDDGKVLKVKGLDEGTYTLSEKVTPTGFDTMDDITFTITPTIEGEDAEGEEDEIPTGALTKLEATVDEGEGATITHTKENTNEVNGYVPMELINMPAGYLPGTGGAGTAWFYVGGTVLLALALMGMLMMNRKPARKEEA